MGSRGRNLLWFPEINNPSFDVLRANAALPAAQRLSTNALRPYKGYSSIRQRRSEAESNYNGLQLYATKRRGDFTFTASYTLSKVETNASGFGVDAEDMNLAYNYGPAELRPPPYRGLHLHLSRAVPPRSRRGAGLGARRLGSERHHAAAVGPYLTPPATRRSATAAPTISAATSSLRRRRRDCAGSTRRRSRRRPRIAAATRRSASSKGPGGTRLGPVVPEEVPAHRAGRRSASRPTSSTCSIA